MAINKELLPIKLHFFFFMAAMGPILPQLPVYGKSLGISPSVMGIITGILPFIYLLSKPAFGIIIDVFRSYRKIIFVAIIIIMTISYAGIYFIPLKIIPKDLININSSSLRDVCAENSTIETENCYSHTQNDVLCTSNCWNEEVIKFFNNTNIFCNKNPQVEIKANMSCNLTCIDDYTDDKCLYQSSSFWSFIILMSLGTIGFNIINSISDALCFDIIGDKYDYGQQRVWGTIGFGISALIAGLMMENFSNRSPNYSPMFLIMIVFGLLDLISCKKLELPIIPAPLNIFKEIAIIFSARTVIVFMVFVIFSGILDSVIIYYLFWYLEDLAKETNTSNLKLLEGLIVAAETLGGEIIFFYFSGKILKRIGHINCFSLCFFNYAIRIGMISLAPSPWWILPIELIMQGPTYALTYTTIVKYADDLATPSTSATMQGIATGMGEGTGYAFGSIIGGLLYQYLGGKYTLQIFSCVGITCGVAHLLLHKIFEKDQKNCYYEEIK